MMDQIHKGPCRYYGARWYVGQSGVFAFRSGRWFVGPVEHGAGPFSTKAEAIAAARRIAAALSGSGAGVEPVALANGVALQALIVGVEPVTPSAAALAVLAKRRALARRFEPMPAGGLFDEVAKAQPDLFA